MEHVLQQLGLNVKESKFYLFLLNEGPKTGAQLAKEMLESRTNTYMVLNKLIGEELIEVDSTSAVKKYCAANPEKLKSLIVVKQREVKQAHTSLTSVLPELASIYNLGQHKPGVVHFEGLSGYKTFQEYISRSGLSIDVLASNVIPENKEALMILEEAVRQRNARGAKARIVFHMDAKKWLNVADFESKGYEVRFWGETPLSGEVAIYGNKVAITAYQPTVIATVITNDIIADTFRVIFEQIWVSAKS